MSEVVYDLTNGATLGCMAPTRKPDGNLLAFSPYKNPTGHDMSVTLKWPATYFPESENPDMTSKTVVWKADEAW